jgi:tRNA threonylcarbamoyladenosine biosynthesis protein TsaE
MDSQEHCQLGSPGAPLAVVTAAAEETRRLAFQLGSVAEAGWAVLLDGPLGAGKTVFAQGLIAGLGYAGRVASPTFTLINEYEGRLRVSHADLYRLDRAGDFAAIGGDELLEETAGVVVVEWAAKLGSAAPEDAMRVELAFAASAAPDDRRRLTFRVQGARYAAAVAVLERWATVASGGANRAQEGCGRE